MGMVKRKSLMSAACDGHS